MDIESLIKEDRYYKMIKELSENKPPNVLMKKQWVDIMIQRVLFARDIKKAEGMKKLSKAALQALKEYDIVHVAGELRLVRKATTRTNSDKMIVPLDSSFEILKQAHLSTNHGSCADMNKWLSDSNYVVSIICCPVLVSSCLKCLLGQEEEHINHQTNDDPVSRLPSSLTSSGLNKRDQPRAKRPARRPICENQLEHRGPSTKYDDLLKGFVDVIDMSTKPDGNFKYILIYQDVTTMFVLIRPIIGTDLETEVSMELIKMFCDSKPPECLMAKIQLQEFLVSVLERLNVMFDGISSDIGCDDQTSNTVTNMITNWMERQGTDNWSVGCYFVQWAINNLINNGATPFQRYFNLKRYQDPIRIEVRAQEKDTTIPIENPTYSLSRIVTDSGERMTIVKSKELMNKEVAMPSNNAQSNLHVLSAQEPSTSSIGFESRPSNSFLNQLSQGKSKELSNKEVAVLNNVPQTLSKTILPQSCETNMPSSVPRNTKIAPHHHGKKSSFDLLDRIMANNPAELLINQPDPEPKIATIDQPIIIDKINEPESIEVKEIETYICCTCNMEMTTQVYICCICRKSLHLYCGARRKGENDVVESICFTCMTLQT